MKCLSAQFIHFGKGVWQELECDVTVNFREYKFGYTHKTKKNCTSDRNGKARMGPNGWFGCDEEQM